jgi:hypothetical protein
MIASAVPEICFRSCCFIFVSPLAFQNVGRANAVVMLPGTKLISDVSYKEAGETTSFGMRADALLTGYTNPSRCFDLRFFLASISLRRQPKRNRLKKILELVHEFLGL